MRIALVHDWLCNLGGAERVLIELHNIFPDTPIYTLFYDKNFVQKYLPNAEIRTSFLQRFPLISKKHRHLALLMPTAIESFNLSSYNLIISSSVVFSKGLVLKPQTKHICYCYSPTRQIWDLHSESRNSIGAHLLRLWDRQAADRVDQFVAISNHVKDRIKKYYRKDSIVIYPPTNNFQIPIFNVQSNSNFQCSMTDYYLIVSRLYKHKNIDVVIEAFNKLNLPLIIIGTGPEYNHLKSKISNPKSIKLLGFVSDDELSYYYQNCKAFIMPQEEDFGLTPIEAMSFGKPVLALRKGGAMETIVEGQTGEFFDDPIPESLADGIRRLNENYRYYDPEKIKHHTQKFSKDRFKKEILTLINNNI